MEDIRCTFNKGVCIRCGFVNTSGLPDEKINANCRLGCKYLGERDESVAPVKLICEGCRGKVQIKYGVHHCSLHSLCLPRLDMASHSLTSWEERPESKLYQLCLTCPDKNLIVRNDPASYDF
jgi:hypothetical protein